MITWEVARTPYLKCGSADCPRRQIPIGTLYLAIRTGTSHPLVRCVVCAKDFEERPTRPPPLPSGVTAVGDIDLTKIVDLTEDFSHETSEDPATEEGSLRPD
jgi:hypothetical protein